MHVSEAKLRALKCPRGPGFPSVALGPGLHPQLRPDGRLLSGGGSGNPLRVWAGITRGPLRRGPWVPVQRLTQQAWLGLCKRHSRQVPGCCLCCGSQHPR